MRTLIGLVLVSALAPLAQSQAPADGEAEARVETTYARVRKPGARLLNVPDQNGRLLRELEAGTVVSVHGERSGWKKAEVPSGFPAWIHSRYLQDTDVPDVVEVARNGVNVRPLPTSSSNNFPVGQLYAGDRVRRLPSPEGLPDEAAEWVHVLSPPGFWAWLDGADLAPLAPGEDGAKLWSEAVGRAVPAARPAAARKEPAAAPPAVEAPATDAKGDAVTRALDRANATFKRETEAQEPDYRVVRLAYDAVLQLDPSEDVRRRVAERLELLVLYESSQELRADVEAEKRRADEEAKRTAERIEAEARRRDPYRYRFDERGLLQRRVTGDETRYWLVWGDRDVCEVLCSSGRYDLALFLGRDVGVRGKAMGPGGAEDAPRALDVTRIEILAGG